MRLSKSSAKNRNGEMKVTIKNLGILESAEYELGDLTVVCGKNNTGKTYAAYALYGFLDYWRNRYEFQIDPATKEIQNTGTNEIRIQRKHIEEHWQKNIDEACQEYQQYLPEVFASQLKHFRDSEFQLALSVNPNKPFFNTGKSSSNWRNDIETQTTIQTVEVSTENDGNTLLLKIDSLYERQPFDFAGIIKSFISYHIVPCASFVSADRMGAAMFSDEIRYLRDEVYQKGKPFTSPIRYSVPVRDNLNAIRDSRILLQPRPEIQEVFSEILGGRFEIDNHRILFIPTDTDQLALTIGESSSSVRSLFALWLQLCNYQHGVPNMFPNMFMIDEPEMSLHPENQRLLARLFAGMVNRGYNVYITTHSDYIVKELNTLMMLNKRNKNNGMVMEKYGYSESEILCPDKVRVYMTQKIEKSNRYTFVPADIDEQGVWLPSFDDTISRMNNIQDEIAFGGNYEQ